MGKEIGVSLAQGLDVSNFLKDVTRALNTMNSSRPCMTRMTLGRELRV